MPAEPFYPPVSGGQLILGAGITGAAIGALTLTGPAFIGVGIVSLVDLYPELEGMDANGTFERFFIDLDSF